MPKLLYPDQCPECGHRLSRSRRHGWIERLVTGVLKVKVFRCHRCQTRFYSPPALIFHARDTEEHLPDRDRVPPEAEFEPAVETRKADWELVEAVEAKLAIPLPLPAPAPSSSQTWTQQTGGGSPVPPANLFSSTSAGWNKRPL